LYYTVRCLTCQPFSSVLLRINNYITTEVMMSVIPDTYGGQRFNKKIMLLMIGAGLRPQIAHSCLQRPLVRGKWTIELPEVAPEKWRDPNFRLVFHAQDFVNWYNNELCVELLWIEQQYSDEQQRKIIFLHWDHNLTEYYEGHIQCVEFASHSYELVHSLHDRWDEWQDVHNKDIKYNFLCLNGQPKPHREKLYDLLKNYKTGYCTHGYKNPAPFALYSNYNWNNITNFINLMPLYQQSKTSIVSETIYADHPGIISEKTILAIAAKHPFMCIGQINIHKQLHERGFENFDELFNLSYDDLDETQRLDAAIELNLANLTDTNWDVDAANEKTERNFDFLMNDYTTSIELRAKKQLHAITGRSY